MYLTRIASSLLSLSILPLPITACGDPGGTHNEGELITTVTASFTPQGGGPAVVAAFDDPDGDGGEPPTVDAIDLVVGMYDLGVTFENRLEEPPEDITVEIADEAEEHQILFTGTAIDGPASDQSGAPLLHAYADTDSHGLPIGLSNTITAVSGGGEMVVTLRHVPPVNDVAVKNANLATQVRTGGFAAIGGSTDAQVRFVVTVQ